MTSREFACSLPPFPTQHQAQSISLPSSVLNPFTPFLCMTTPVYPPSPLAQTTGKAPPCSLFVHSCSAPVPYEHCSSRALFKRQILSISSKLSNALLLLLEGRLSYWCDRQAYMCAPAHLFSLISYHYLTYDCPHNRVTAPSVQGYPSLSTLCQRDIEKAIPTPKWCQAPALIWSYSPLYLSFEKLITSFIQWSTSFISLRSISFKRRRSVSSFIHSDN